MTLSDLFTIACAAAALCGLVAGFVGARRLIRLFRAQHCPWCGYDLRGLTTGVCPECGPRPRPGRWRAAGWLAAAPVLVAVLPMWLLWPRPFRMAWWWVRYPTWKMVSSCEFGGLVIREYEGGRPDNWITTRYVAAFERKTVREHWDVHLMHPGTTRGSPGDPVPYPGPDLNHDGTPEVVLLEYSGGAHCCYTAYVYDVSGPPVLLGELDGRHTPPHFEDLDHNGYPAAVVKDWTWDYFYSFAEAPAPRVILRWTGTGFVVAPDLMRTESPDEKTLVGYEDELRLAMNYLSVPPPMLRTMLDLMYTGHEAAAWRLFDRIYPHPTREQEEWLDKFRRSLEASPYWPALHAAWGTGE